MTRQPRFYCTPLHSELNNFCLWVGVLSGALLNEARKRRNESKGLLKSMVCSGPRSAEAL